MIPAGPVPFSKTLTDVYAQNNNISQRHRRIVIDTDRIYSNSPGYFLRQCSDVDYCIPAEYINNWHELIYCDFKIRDSVFPSACLDLLEKFTLNPQPIKILHISLDIENVDAKKLIGSVPKFRKNNKVIIEINDRTDTISSSDDARLLLKCIQAPVDHVYYWNSKLFSWGGYGLELSDPQSQPVYY